MRHYTSFIARTCPLLFLTFFSFLRKYLIPTNQTTLNQITTNPDLSSSKKKKKPQRSQPNHSPKLGLGANLVRSPEFHPINLRVLIRFSWQSPPNDLVLVKLHLQTKTPLAKAQTLILSHVSKKMIRNTN